MVGSHKWFRPGDIAPVSGVYLVLHEDDHRRAHEVLVIRGEELPACRVCQSGARYKVVRPTSHVTHDWDFAGPLSLAVKDGSAAYSIPQRSPRYKLEMAVRVALGAITVRGDIRDLSTGGLGASLESVLPATRASVILNIDQPGEGMPVRIPARVCYREGYRHGFQFVGIGEEERAWVNLQLNRAASTAGA